jgi:hypothetical protein
VSAQDRLRELSDFAAPWAAWIAATEDEFRRLAESVGLQLRSSPPVATGNALVELHVG